MRPLPFLPRRTVRLRLTALYGALFVLSGAALLALTNVWSVSFGTYGTEGVPAVTQHTPLGQAQARIKELQSQVIALSDHLQALESHQLLAASVFSLSVMAVVSTVLGWLVAGRILRPLRAITAATREISEDDLDRRLAVSGPNDELKELADTIDGLLARLQGAFNAQRQFVANASHELRTPLTLERTTLEVALGDPAATAATLRSACEEVLLVGQQQERLIEALLTLARSQRGLDHQEPVDLAEIARRVLEARQPQARALALDIRAVLAPAPTIGDPRLTERMVANLADNALRYNQAGGRVEVTTGLMDGRAGLRIVNTGPEVPADQVQRLLQPFQRLNPGRTGEADGLGLGLSIVAAIAKAHQAVVSAHPRPGGGLSIEVSFAAQAKSTAVERSRADSDR